MSAVSRRPASTYKKGVVVYHWRKCPHSVRFMSSWDDEIRGRLLKRGLNVWEIEVEDHKSELERLGVSLGAGVPRVVFFNEEGVGMVHKGDRSVSSVLAGAASHVGISGGGGGGRPCQRVSFVCGVPFACNGAVFSSQLWLLRAFSSNVYGVW